MPDLTSNLRDVLEDLDRVHERATHVRDASAAARRDLGDMGSELRGRAAGLSRETGHLVTAVGSAQTQVEAAYGEAMHELDALTAAVVEREAEVAVEIADTLDVLRFARTELTRLADVMRTREEATRTALEQAAELTREALLQIVPEYDQMGRWLEDTYVPAIDRSASLVGEHRTALRKAVREQTVPALEQCCRDLDQHLRDLAGRLQKSLGDDGERTWKQAQASLDELAHAIDGLNKETLQEEDAMSRTLDEETSKIRARVDEAQKEAIACAQAGTQAAGHMAAIVTLPRELEQLLIAARLLPPNWRTA